MNDENLIWESYLRILNENNDNLNIDFLKKYITFAYVSIFDIDEKDVYITSIKEINPIIENTHEVWSILTIINYNNKIYKVHIWIEHVNSHLVYVDLSDEEYNTIPTDEEVAAARREIAARREAELKSPTIKAKVPKLTKNDIINNTTDLIYYFANIYVKNKYGKMEHILEDKNIVSDTICGMNEGIGKFFNEIKRIIDKSNDDDRDDDGDGYIDPTPTPKGSLVNI